MRVSVLDGLGNILEVSASRVLVTSDDGTPVALAVAVTPELIDIADCEDANFNAKLRLHGIGRQVRVADLRPPRVADFNLKG